MSGSARSGRGFYLDYYVMTQADVRKPHSSMLRIARETSGVSGTIATVLVYHPVEAAAILALRLKLAGLDRWKSFQRIFLRFR